MKKDCRELDSNKGSSAYQTDAPEGMANGLFLLTSNVWYIDRTFITLKGCQGRVILDRWLSQWMTRANLLQFPNISIIPLVGRKDISFILTIFPKNFWNKWYLIWKLLYRAFRISKKIGRGIILRVATPP